MDPKNRRNEELQELIEQEKRIQDEIVRLKSEAIACLVKDMEIFPEREIKRRFLTYLDFGASFSSDDISAVKQEIAKAIPGIVSEATACLNQESRWAAGKDFIGPGKSLAENAELWECMQPLEAMVVAILKKYDFPKQDLTYKMPTWFIDHTYMPSISEKYWQLIHDLEDVRKQVNELNQRILRDQLTKKWDLA